MKKEEDLLLPMNNTVVPKSHPPHYMMHKYWGRKSHNVVAEYIKHFTKEGDTVLDPFMGSGVTIIESLKINRKTIGVDLNPITNMIVKNTIYKADLQLLEEHFHQIYRTVTSKYTSYYNTNCSTCDAVCVADNYVWKEDQLIKVKYTCKNCGIQREDVKTEDVHTFQTAKTDFETVKHERYYPTDAMLKYVRRNGKTHINQLFTERALLILTDIYAEIKKVEDSLTRNLLFMCFTSALPNVSKMIPADEKNVTGKSGWQISKFWVPKVHTEKNVLESFEHRFKRIVKGKSEINHLNASNASIYNTSSESLPFIETGSIDYIFTDPPYGESINYFGLSMLWNSWLEQEVDYNGEIIYDPYRKKDYDDYEVRMNNVFKELSRVLKMNHYLSLTFHNRDLKVWKSVLNACRLNGFHLKNIVYQPQAVASGTQGINKKNTFRGDFIYNFQKISDEAIELTPFEGDFVEFVKRSAKEIIEKYKGATPDQLYSELIPQLVNTNALFNDENNKLNVDSILEEEFIYIETIEEGKSIYEWKTAQLVKNTEQELTILKNRTSNTDLTGSTQKTDAPTATETEQISLFVDHSVVEDNKDALNVIDLFAGAGGLSAGFQAAGCNIVLANEFEETIAKTYQSNHPFTKVIVGDIRDVSVEEMQKMIGDQRVHIVTGGPPCQGFSMSGNRIRTTSSFIDDPRNYLFKEFYKVVEYFKPQYFVMENVEGLLTMDKGAIFDVIYESFEQLGYTMDYDVLDARKFGVPQARKRLIIIGSLGDKVTMPEPTHGDQLIPYVTIQDAISDLNYLHAGEGEDISSYKMSPQSSYQKERRHNSSILYNHVSTNHSKLAIERMELVKPGENREQLPQEHQTKSVHSGAYGRMEWDSCATTITTRFDTPSVGRVIHPELHRTITVREAARLQSFDDQYRFHGSRSSQGIQVGNAVPPLLAKAIATKIIDSHNAIAKINK